VCIESRARYVPFLWYQGFVVDLDLTTVCSKEESWQMIIILPFTLDLRVWKWRVTVRVTRRSGS
jgi:hypothetical protein